MMKFNYSNRTRHVKPIVAHLRLPENSLNCSLDDALGDGLGDALGDGKGDGSALSLRSGRKGQFQRRSRAANSILRQ